MSDPRNFSPKTRRLAWQRCRARCEGCGVKLVSGNIRFDHIIPWEISGDSSLENCQVLCRRSCDFVKTYSKDLPEIAKVHRLFDRDKGIKREGKKLPGGKDSDITITMNRGVQRRRSGPQKHQDFMADRYSFGWRPE